METMRKLRLCYINDKEGNHIRKALFHGWFHASEIVYPSNTLGGHPGGVIEGELGLVEYEDGSVHKVLPERIQFADDMSEIFSYIPDYEETTDDSKRNIDAQIGLWRDGTEKIKG